MHILKLGNRYPLVGALAYRRGKARASDLPPQLLQCNYQLNLWSSQCDCFQNLAYKAKAESDHKAYYQNISPFEKKSYLGRLVPYAIKTQKYQVAIFSLLTHIYLYTHFFWKKFSIFWRSSFSQTLFLLFPQNQFGALFQNSSGPALRSTDYNPSELIWGPIGASYSHLKYYSLLVADYKIS